MSALAFWYNNLLNSSVAGRPYAILAEPVKSKMSGEIDREIECVRERQMEREW